jgi:hypothetical protein
MAITAPNAISAIPVSDDSYITGNPINTNVINPGDWVAFSGTGILACSTALASWKISGAGIAMDRNPAIDQFGNSVVNSGLIIATHGVFRVSAAFSGAPDLGVLAGPDTTGSAVNAPTGLTGVGGVWETATPVSVSGGTAAAPVPAVAQVIGWYNSGPAGTGQLDIRVWPRNADYY